MAEELTIGRLAQTVSLPPKTIRYYEEIGLVPGPKRTPAGYRVYSPEEVRRLHLIRRSRLLGLSLAQTKELVDHVLDGRCSSLRQHLAQIIPARLGEIDRRIAELTSLRADLERLLAKLAQESDEVTGDDAALLECSDCQCFG